MPEKQTIRVAIAGVGNCASSLIQGAGYYASRRGDTVGLMHETIGQWSVGDIEVVCAFDIDSRKVGRRLTDAIFSPPNNTHQFFVPLPGRGPIVQMGPVLDGVPDHMADYPQQSRFDVSRSNTVDVVKVLRESGAEILVNYMPVGAQEATEFYAGAALEAGVALLNCVPVFIASDASWAAKFVAAGLPCVGDDVKAQLGATITHRMLGRLLADRGVRMDATYQLNTGGNTDFLNMLSRDRLTSKRQSKTGAVQSQIDPPLDPGQIHIGPSDYIPFLRDNKVCFMRIDGTGFGGVPLSLELKLSVEDSPNSAGVVVDAIRCCKLALDAGLKGPIEPVCAWLMKHPPRQMPDADARLLVEKFIDEHSGAS
ncbi:MAG: inositol-3-phosphate synthase [Tepidisphaeraceae bacterium]